MISCSFGISFLIILHHSWAVFVTICSGSVVVILTQSAHRGGSPCWSPTWQHGNCLCLMFQTGALSRTGGSFCPSATGHLTVFYSTPLFLSSGRKKKSIEMWRCRSVRALKCQFPKRISCVHLIPKPWCSELVCCVWTGPGALNPANSHRFSAASTQTMDVTYHSLCASVQELLKITKTLLSLPNTTSVSSVKGPLKYSHIKYTTIEKHFLTLSLLLIALSISILLELIKYLVNDFGFCSFYEADGGHLILRE